MPKRGQEWWQGAVVKRPGRAKLYLKLKVHGQWILKVTPFEVGEEKKAGALLREMREEILAAEAAMKGDRAPVTVRAWAKRWLETRSTSRRDDESILKHHILTEEIADYLLVDVQSRHVLALVEKWQPKDDDGNPAPGAPAGRTVSNWYSALRCMFRDAALRGLIPISPCIITAPHLPPREDKDSEWRISARYSRKELEILISPHPEIELDSTVVYALLGLGALRHGELASLRWRHIVEREPLDAMLVANSNRRRRTKVGKTRMMPIHPVLASILAEWRLTGWQAFIGRPPTDDDLIVPLPAVRIWRGRHPKKAIDPAHPDVRMRNKNFTWKRLDRHLEAVGCRGRRVHDLRRTFVGLATSNGADDRILYWGTHGRPGDIMSAYNDADWRRVCEHVSMLKVTRRRSAGGVLPLRRWTDAQDAADTAKAVDPSLDPNRGSTGSSKPVRAASNGPSTRTQEG